MLLETVAAWFLVACLAVFFSVNLINLALKGREKGKAYAEVEQSMGFLMGIVALGTILYFMEALLYSFLVFTNQIGIIQGMPLQLRFPCDIYVQFFGFLLTASGYFLFIWSVIVRGRYATSWEMSENHKLVTCGPYRYVRHPSYLGYFLMFPGLFFMLLNVMAVLPLTAIPGYVYVTVEEEKLLIKRFGDDYRRYQKQTGRFFPKWRK